MGEAAKTVVYLKEYFLFDIYENRYYPVHDDMLIGRENSDLSLVGSKGTSSRHARIRIKGINLFIEDLDSTNGTYVNNQLIEAEPVELVVGNEIKIGDRLLILTENENYNKADQNIRSKNDWVNLTEKIIYDFLGLLKDFGFWIGVIAFPYIICWFTLRKGFNKKVRIITFVYAVAAMVYTFLLDDAEEDKKELAKPGEKKIEKVVEKN